MGRFIPNDNTYIGFTPSPVGKMAAPTGVAATPGAGGSLTAGSISYIITAINGTGETLGSAAASGTADVSNKKMTVTWSAVVGATGYRIYGRVAGSQKLIAQVGTVLTWTDDGTSPPGVATPPVSGTASDYRHPVVADVNAAIDLTEFVSGLNFAAQGNTVPTPNLRKMFETSIPGTVQAQAQMDCYRDDAVDTAWAVLPRGATGTVFISRYGGKPGVSKTIEVWPVRVTSRTNANMTSNTPTTFTASFSVLDDPAEDAIIAA